MESKRGLFVLLACVLFAGVLGDTTKPPAPVPVPTSTLIPVPVPTDPPATTPAPATTTTSAPATTTTPAPATTTTTTPAPATTTTPAPAPTTTPAPAPAPTTPPTPPTPAPSPDGRGNWTVQGDNVTCIIAQMIVSAKVEYPLQAVNQTGKVTFVVPANATGTGSCDANSQTLNLAWDKNSVQVDFKKNDTTKMYFISKIQLTFVTDPNIFHNISKNLTNEVVEFDRVQQDFMINVNQSFRCTREQDLPLQQALPKNESIRVVLALGAVQLQAFHAGPTRVFGAAQDCELDTPDIVPIAVGCALAALVCVVLVAYLIGRRRSQARGYLSM